MSKRLERTTSSKDLSKSNFPVKKRCTVATADSIGDTVHELGQRLDSFLDTLEGLLQLITVLPSDEGSAVDMDSTQQSGS